MPKSHASVHERRWTLARGSICVFVVGCGLVLGPAAQAREKVDPTDCNSLTEDHPDYAQCLELLDEKRPADFLSDLRSDFLSDFRSDLRSGLRYGLCVGLTTDCLLVGVKIGYAQERFAYYVNLPWLDVELNWYPQNGLRYSSSNHYRRIFYSFDGSIVPLPLVGVAAGMDIQTGTWHTNRRDVSILLRPKVGLDIVGFVWAQDFDRIPIIPTASFSLIVAR
jgi:hypothetical protein